MHCHQSLDAMTLCFHSVTAYLKITLHMRITRQDLARSRFKADGLQSARFENTFLEGWEPKERLFHA